MCPGGCEDRRHTGVGRESESDNIACPQVGGTYAHVLSQTQLTPLLGKSGGAVCEWSVFPESLTPELVL